MSTVPHWAERQVSPALKKKFSDYVALLLKWNKAINLVGPATEADVWNRHIWDSFQLVESIPESATTLADLGCGAGLPGIVIALAKPELNVTLVESDQRKCSFLREVAQALGATNITVENTDIENITGSFDVVTARALAPMVELCGYAAPLVGTGSICFFPKGETFVKELEAAAAEWSYKVQLIHSKTHQKSCIVSITELKKHSSGQSA